MSDSPDNSKESSQGKPKSRRPPDDRELVTAEEAALWCIRLESAATDPDVRKEFFAWMKQSPMHVKEMLLANSLDHELGKYDPKRKLNLDALFIRAANNVTPFVPEKRDDAPEVITEPKQQQPLHLLESVAKFVSRAAYEAFLESAIAEARVEIYQAKRKITATMIQIRCYWTILKPLRAALWATLMLWLRWKGS